MPTADDRTTREIHLEHLSLFIVESSRIKRTDDSCFTAHDHVTVTRAPTSGDSIGIMLRPRQL